MEELQFDSLEGSGQAHYAVQDYFDCAIEAEEKSKLTDPTIGLSVEVVHRPDHVDPLREKWRDAHYEIASRLNVDPDPTGCLQEFRNLLVSKAKNRHLVPPTEYKEG